VPVVEVGPAVVEQVLPVWTATPIGAHWDDEDGAGGELEPCHTVAVAEDADRVLQWSMKRSSLAQRKHS